MNRWCAVSLMPILASLLALPVLAADRTCSRLTVETDPVVRASWPGATERLRETLDARDDLDACARVRLSMRDRTIVVEVVLPDGRFAARSVSRQEDLVPTLEALLLVPMREQSSEPAPQRLEAPPPTAAAAPIVIVNVNTHTAPADRVAPSEPQPGEADPDRVGIELSLATGARVGDRQMSLGVGALSFLDLAGWLVGIAARADQYQGLAAGTQPLVAVELAALAGHRFRFENLALDVTAGPAVALSDGDSTVSRAVANDTGETIARMSSSAGQPLRLLFGTRLIFNPRSLFRAFVGLDGDIATVRPHDVQLPNWTFGLALGATVGTR